MPAQLDHRHLAGGAGAQRRLLEVEADQAARQEVGALGVGGEDQHPLELLSGEIVDLEDVADGHGWSAFPMSSTAWSISSSVMSSDGARRTAVGVTAFATHPSSSSRATTALASASTSSTPSRRPAPRTAATPSRARRAVLRRAPAASALAGTSSACITSSTDRKSTRLNSSH